MTTTNFLLQYAPYFIYLLTLNVLFLRKLGRQTKGTQILLLLLLFVYLAVVGYLCLTPPVSVKLPHFSTMKPYWLGSIPTNPIPFRGIGLDFYLNILLTFPLGLSLPFLTKPLKFKQVLYLGFGTGLGIELTQFILDWLIHLNRWVDINDVLMNGLGFLLGWLLFCLGMRYVPNWLQKFKLN